MPYDSNTGKITKPLNTADVSKALGVGSLDVGKLCTSRKNIWAKYAPIEVSGVIGELSTDNRYNANHGYTFTQYNNISTLFTAGKGYTEVNQNAWARTLPSTWYRLFDFAGYNKHAGCPFPFSIVESASTNVNDHIYVGKGADGSRLAVSDYELGIAEFRTLHDTSNNVFNAGVAWKASDGTGSLYAMTFDSEAVGEIPNNTTYFTTGKTYDVVFFFVNKTFATPTMSPGDGIYYLAPYPLKSFSYVSGELNITLSIALNSRKDAFTLTIASADSNSYTIRKINVEHTYNDFPFNYWDTPSSVITVSPSSSYTHTFSIQSGDSFLDAEQLYFKAYVYINNTQNFLFPVDLRSKDTPTL